MRNFIREHKSDLEHVNLPKELRNLKLVDAITYLGLARPKPSHKGHFSIGFLLVGVAAGIVAYYKKNEVRQALNAVRSDVSDRMSGTTLEQFVPFIRPAAEGNGKTGEQGQVDHAEGNGQRSYKPRPVSAS